MSGTHYESRFFAGFTFSGNQNLDALAGFYGFAVPSLEPQITLAEYLARTCYGRPRPGYRIMIGGVELIVLELDEGVITKVGLRALPQEWSRQRRRVPSSAAYDVGASLVRRNRGLSATAAPFR
jgi:NhaP-type Na+/H+ and K+/H+ antiporter